MWEGPLPILPPGGYFFMKRGKKYQDAVKAFDKKEQYDVADAISIVKKNATAKFDETIELHLRTGCDGRHAEQQIRGAVVLPHGTGKTVKVLVFAKGTKLDEAQAAGAVSSRKKEGMSTGMIVLIVILCILASPVILGAASAGIGVAAGLIATWFGLIIGFGATAAALILLLIALVAVGIISMFTHPFVGMCLIGAGLICGGVGLLFLMLTVAMAGIATPAICCWIGGLFQKRGKAEA